MSINIELVRPTPVNRDISPRSVDNGRNRILLNPTLDRLNSRYRSSESGQIEGEQNIPGTIGYNPPLPAGANKQIGSFTDSEAGRIIFFNWNSNSNHGVYTWNPITKQFTTIIVSPYLNFQDNPKFRITGVGVVQNLLYFTDGFNPVRSLNMTRDYSNITSDASINLYKRPPVKAPDDNSSNLISRIEPFLNNAFKTSNIAGNIYQFSTRYVYIDNEISAIGPYSNYASSGARDTLSKFQFNGFQFYIHIQNELKPVISKVQLLYRKNNDSSWYLYSEHSVPSFGINDFLVVEFYDDNANIVIPDIEANKLFDSVPIKSKALTYFKGRNFLTADQEGYNVNQEQNFNINTQISNSTVALKEGGTYTYGLAYYDKDLRTAGVTKIKKLSIPYEDSLGLGADLAKRTNAIIQILDNNYPPWAKYVGICRTVEQNYEQYMQIPVKMMFYVGEGELKDQAGNNIGIPVGMEKYTNGKVYRNELPSPVRKFSHIHLQVPESIPFEPDSECFVRFCNIVNKIEIIPVLAYDGQVIVINNIENVDWSFTGFDANNGSGGFIRIEVFKLKKVPAKPLYELPSALIQLPLTTPFNLVTLPDTYTTDRPFWKFKNLKINGAPSDDCYDPSSLTTSPFIETPSIVLNNVLGTGTNGLRPTLNFNYDRVESLTSYIPDYRRIPDYPGRIIAYNPNAKEQVRNTTIRFSDPYIQDSNFNGLSSFSFSNEYPIPTYRTPILKLQNAGNVMLAIHERATTTIYVGEGFIRESGGSFINTKTDSVIGQDRELIGGYGSYHPESIAEHNGLVFGFDIFQGVIWQYDNNGQVAVSNFGLKSFFKRKAEQYLPYKDQVSIIGGIDPYHKEYLITFPAVNVAGNAVIQPETWAFNWLSNEWHRFSFIPECYAHINNNLISFAAGKLWVHNSDFDNYNTFYGEKYDREITIAVNPFCTKHKRFLAIQQSVENLNDVDGQNIVMEIRNREGQYTYSRAKWFEKKQGIFSTEVLMDTTTNPLLLPPNTIALRDGKYILSQVLELKLINNSNSPAIHYYSNVSWHESMYTV